MDENVPPPLLPHNRRSFTRAEAERLNLAYDACAAGGGTVPA